MHPSRSAVLNLTLFYNAGCHSRESGNPIKKTRFRIKSGMTLSVKQFMKYHFIYLITQFSIGFVIPSQKYCFFAGELLDSPHLSVKVYEVGYSYPCLLAIRKIDPQPH